LHLKEFFLIQKSLCIVPVIITIKRKIVIKGIINIINKKTSTLIKCGSKAFGKYNNKGIKKNIRINLVKDIKKFEFLTYDIFLTSFIKCSSFSYEILGINLSFIVLYN